MPNNPLAERESKARGICFNKASGVVLAWYERHEDRRIIDSVYLRDPVSRNYERLSPPDDRTSYTCPVAARDVPYAYFNVMAIGDDGGGQWRHVARLHVPTRQVEIVFTQEDLFAATGTPRPSLIWPWVSALLSASDDGRVITCNIGLPEPRADGGCRMNYSLFGLDVPARAVIRLADLDSPYC